MVAQQQEAFLLAALGQQEKLRRLRRLPQLPLEIREIHGARHGAGDDIHGAGMGQVHGQIQALPGGQGRHVAARSGGLGAQVGDLGGVGVDLLRRRQVVLYGGLIQEGLLPYHGPGRQQSRFRRGHPVQSVQRRFQHPKLGTGLGGGGLLPAEHVLPEVLVRRGLLELEAAQLLQPPQQRIPVTLQGDKLEMLHFNNGHLSAPPPFP